MVVQAHGKLCTCVAPLRHGGVRRPHVAHAGVGPRRKALSLASWKLMSSDVVTDQSLNIKNDAASKLEDGLETFKILNLLYYSISLISATPSCLRWSGISSQHCSGLPSALPDQRHRQCLGQLRVSRPSFGLPGHRHSRGARRWGHPHACLFMAGDLKRGLGAWLGGGGRRSQESRHSPGSRAIASTKLTTLCPLSNQDL